MEIGLSVLNMCSVKRKNPV